MLRCQDTVRSRKRIGGAGLFGIAKSIGKFLLPVLGKALEPVGEALGHKLGKFIKGEGVSGITAHSLRGDVLKGGGTRLPWERGGSKKKIHLAL